MKKSLFITEKPSVAMEFKNALGIKGSRKNGFIEDESNVVTWCVGHLVSMSYPEKYDPRLKRWDLTTLPFIPEEYKYEVIDNVKDQFDVVSILLNRDDIDTIYVCTDSGREGEYIYRLVEQMSNVSGKKRKRVWINSQTEDEIKRGVKEALDLEEFDALSDSAYLRAIEDYLAGINFSRLLTLLYSGLVSIQTGQKNTVVVVGRVMTCVLGMIVGREREIRAFEKKPFYKINGSFELEKDDGVKINSEWKSVEATKYYESPVLFNEKGFKTKDDATKLCEHLKSEDFALVSKVTKKKENKNPPLLFNLAELQNTCSKTFKISPDKTLEVAQSLYEKKLITYPRTDARVLSKTVALEVKKNVSGLAGFTYDTKIQEKAKEVINGTNINKIAKSKYVDDKKITDHYAIIPTGQNIKIFNSLSKLEQDVFVEITKRFLAVFLDSAVYNKISIEIKLKDEYFYTNSKVCTNIGYLSLYDDSKNEQNEQASISNIRKGEKLRLKELEIKEGETTPPKRYSSGNIILAMENAGKLIEDDRLREQIKGSGIGTSATRAEIIKKLERLGYININKKTQTIKPQLLGEIIYDIVRVSIRDLLNPRLTASWEKGLEMIVNKEISSKEYKEKLEVYIRKKVTNLLNHNIVLNPKDIFAQIPDFEVKTVSKEKNTLGLCPMCKRGIVFKSEKGYGCSLWRSGCKFFIGEFCGVKIEEPQIIKLIEEGKTDLITGFKSKKGNEFDARISYSNGKMDLIFAK